MNFKVSFFKVYFWLILNIVKKIIIGISLFLAIFYLEGCMSIPQYKINGLINTAIIKWLLI
ncbi:hypothetical protein PsalMR5_00104 [Piscirickettsia salmonis]|nr:hypothetical protein PsalSR1_00104 [Piscirickettsia salmonis]QGP57582.1 hypothetical protein PsalBI1_00114 [Piscirickettsia salmonis]QGP62287.1 hypothetical protein PsalMR5_00104 [Piscirickettsia salmonis]